MEVGGWAGRLMQVGEWIFRLCYVNFIWIIFTILGLGILGLFPATAALYSVVRKWRTGVEDQPVFKTFWETYRCGFWQLNGLMFAFALMGLAMILDFRLLRMMEDSVFGWIYPLLIVVFLIYLISLLYLFPLYVHYRMSFFQYILQSFLVTLRRPQQSVLLAVTVVLCYALFHLLPGGLTPFVGGSLPAYLVFRIAHRAFRELETGTLPSETG